MDKGIIIILYVILPSAFEKQMKMTRKSKPFINQFKYKINVSKLTLCSL